MRVLIDYRPALRLRTGVGEYVHQLAAALVPLLAAEGSLTLFSSSWKDRLPPDVPAGARTTDVRVPVRVLNLAWHRLEWPPVESFAGEVDVAHALHPLMIPARRAAQVVTIHDLHFMSDPSSAIAEIRRDYPALAAAHARRADGVIVVSRYTAGLVESRFGVARDRIAICPPGAPRWGARRAPAPAGPILFVGTVEPRKNLPALLAAYKILMRKGADVPPLVIAGGVRPDSVHVLDDLNDPVLAGKVRHIGYVHDAQRERLYGDASMLVLPSLDEGFGLPALEAMAAGVPVVVSNRGALPEVVGEAGLVVDPDDAEGIADAMHRLLGEPGLSEACVIRGLARAHEFRWESTAGRVLEAYRAAIARRAARL